MRTRKNPVEDSLLPLLIGGGVVAAFLVYASQSSSSGASGTRPPVPVPPGGFTGASTFGFTLAEEALRAVGKPVGDAGTIAKAVSNLIGQAAATLGVARPLPDVASNDALINEAQDDNNTLVSYNTFNKFGKDWFRFRAGDVIVGADGCPLDNSIAIVTKNSVKGSDVLDVVLFKKEPFSEVDEKTIVPAAAKASIKALVASFKPTYACPSGACPCGFLLVFSDPAPSA